MKEYVFDLSRITSMDQWWDMYVDTVHGPECGLFGRNRDAYSDSLKGGPGCPETPCRFVFENVKSIQCADLLSRTKNELEQKRKRCHPSNVSSIDQQIALLDVGIGETMLNWIIDPPMFVEGIEVIVK